MATNLEKVKIGQYKGDPSGDSARQFIQKFNNNMEKILVGENVVSSGQDPSTGLGWDTNSQTIYIDLQEDHLTYGTSDGVTSLSVSEVIKKGLSSFGISSENLVQAVTDLSQHLAYRKTLLDVKKSSDHTYYSLIFIENRADTLPRGIAPIYVWMPDSDQEPNDTFVIKPDDVPLSESGRWVLPQQEALMRVFPSDVLWVSPNGNDNWEGVFYDRPLANLSTAISKAEPWTTIFLYPGVYNLDSTQTLQEGVSLKAYTAYSDSKYKGEDKVVLRGQSPDLTLIQANPNTFIEGVTFEGEGTGAPLLLFIETGMSLGSHDIPTLEEQNNSISKIKNCSFAPVSKDKTINAIRATVSGENNRLKPIYLPNPTVYIENCSIVSYGGVGIQVERFVWVNVIYSHFEYNDIAVLAQEDGICRLDSSFFNYGNKGIVSSDGHSQRCVAEVMSPSTSGDKEIFIRYKWSENQEPSFPYNPKSFLYLNLINGNPEFEGMILSTEERIDNGNDPIHYRVELETELNQDINPGQHFQVLQGSVIEAMACVSYYIGAGVNPEDYSGIHNPSLISEETGTGLAIWS